LAGVTTWVSNPSYDAISVLDGTEEHSLPEWAASLIWLGSWCRGFQDPARRLVSVAVMPARDLAAAFAALGALLAGAELYKDELSWPRFRVLPAGTTVYLKSLDGKVKYSGIILGTEELDGSEFMKISVTKPASNAKSGLVLSVSKRHFDGYLCRLEKPPSEPETESLAQTRHFLASLNPRIHDKWIWADGAEALVVTKIASFDQSLINLSLRGAWGQTAAISDLLCMARSGGSEHAKLRLTHPRGDISGAIPLAILDGKDPLEIHEHLKADCNLLVLLARHEYTDGIDDLFLQLKAASRETVEVDNASLPDRLPPGMDIRAYLVDRR